MTNGFPPTELPWYKSKIIVGAAISIITKILVMAGVVTSITPADSDSLANIVVLVIGGIGDLMAIGARVAQKRAPEITAT